MTKRDVTVKGTVIVTKTHDGATLFEIPLGDGGPRILVTQRAPSTELAGGPPMYLVTWDGDDKIVDIEVNEGKVHGEGVPSGFTRGIGHAASDLDTFAHTVVDAVTTHGIDDINDKLEAIGAQSRVVDGAKLDKLRSLIVKGLEELP